MPNRVPPLLLTTIGTIEGFYGPPWTHEQRLAHLRFCAAAGFDSFVYAPKDDPYHRRHWREPYPAPDLERIAELARAADGLGLRFVYALHPALSMRYSEDTEHAALAAKAAQLYEAGVRSFALLFDDVPYELDPADEPTFGTGGGGLGAAHGVTVRRFVDGFLRPHGIAGPLLVCPTDYAGIEPSAYRDALADTAPDEIVITWTGRGVVVGSVTRAEIDAAFESYRRPLLLWDNFPVNDFEPSRLFLGPLVGRTGELAGSAIVGMISNAMIEEPPSRIPLATAAQWARDPAAYDPVAAHASALASLGASALEPLVRVCSTWPPSADQDPELTAATRAAAAGDRAAAELVERRLSELAACCRSAAEPEELVTALQPWLAGAAATAAAGLAAVQLLREGRSPEQIDAVRAALADAESHYPNVLRTVVPPFVRAVLDRFAPANPGDGRPVALVLTEAPDDASVRAAQELLTERGFAVRFDAPLDTASVVVVTTSAPLAELGSVASAAVPVVAWGGLVELGMATAAGAEMLWHGVQIVAPDDPLAAGFTGTVALYQGPGYVSVASVGPGARVVARGPDDEGRPVVFRYAAGDELASGAPAPGPRIGLFPAKHGPARWLLDETGRAVFTAAIELAAGRAPNRH